MSKFSAPFSKPLAVSEPKRHQRALSLFSIGAVAAIAISYALSILPFDMERQWGLPLLYRLRGALAPPNQAAVVTINRKSAEALKLYPDYRRWPRTYYAQLIKILKAAGARVIVFDIFFNADRVHDAAENEAFGQAMAEANNIVLASKVVETFEDADKGPIAPLSPAPATKRARDQLPALSCRFPEPALGDAASTVAPFLVSNQGERADHFWAHISSPCVSPTLPVAAAIVYWSTALPVLADSIQRAGSDSSLAKIISHKQAAPVTVLAIFNYLRQHQGVAQMMLHDLEGAELNASGKTTASSSASFAREDRDSARALLQLTIGEEFRYFNLVGPPLTIPTYQISDVLSLRPDALDWVSFAQNIKDRAIFIGASELTPQDQKDSSDAFNTVFQGDDGLRLQGVELAANAFLNVISGNDLKRTSQLKTFALLVALGAALMVAWASLSNRRAVFVTSVLCGLFLAVACYRFSIHAIWDPVISVIALALFTAFGATVVKRLINLESLVYKLPKILRDEYLRSGRIHSTHHCVFLICDIANWTPDINRANNASRMQDYIEGMARIVEACGGYFNDVRGDEISAYWVRQTETDEQLAESAITGAATMLASFNHLFSPSNETQRLRIGLCAGMLDFRDIRDTGSFRVNQSGEASAVASRLESLNKELVTHVLTNEELSRQCATLPRRLVGEFVLIGKLDSLPVYECMPAPVYPPDITGWLGAAFEAALDDLRIGNHLSARAKFEEILERAPADGPTHYYLARIQDAEASGKLETLQQPIPQLSK